MKWGSRVLRNARFKWNVACTGWFLMMNGKSGPVHGRVTGMLVCLIVRVEIDKDCGIKLTVGCNKCLFVQIVIRIFI